jgi:hypothetical protein
VKLLEYAQLRLEELAEVGYVTLVMFKMTLIVAALCFVLVPSVIVGYLYEKFRHLKM